MIGVARGIVIGVGGGGAIGVGGRVIHVGGRVLIGIGALKLEGSSNRLWMGRANRNL